MTDLADKIEAAEGPSVQLFREAFEAVHGPKPARIHGGSAELDAWLDRFNPYYGHITRGAWLDAAMTLVPEGVVWTVASDNPAISARPYAAVGDEIAEAATPALALCTAALRARTALKGESAK